uniref:Secreted protein n=1 Tax=Caenorhabditis tropicalis TaxID=1561998 RepID=A0A1I7V0U4_9PELO
MFLVLLFVASIVLASGYHKYQKCKWIVPQLCETLIRKCDNWFKGQDYEKSWTYGDALEFIKKWQPAARASEEFWESIGQMGGLEMSTMGWDSDKTGGGSDDDDGRISDQEAVKERKELQKDKYKEDVEESEWNQLGGRLERRRGAMPLGRIV